MMLAKTTSVCYPLKFSNVGTVSLSWQSTKILVIGAKRPRVYQVTPAYLDPTKVVSVARKCHIAGAAGLAIANR